MIEKLNRDFIPLELNISDKGFPENLKGLGRWKRIYSLNPISKYGFTACVVVSPDGKDQIADAGSASAELWRTSAHYHGATFLKMLDESLKKFKAEY